MTPGERSMIISATSSSAELCRPSCTRWLHDSIWRLEWFYEYGLSYNKGGLDAQTGQRASTSAIYDKVTRDTYGFGLNYQDNFDIPYITRHWFQNNYFQ